MFSFQDVLKASMETLQLLIVEIAVTGEGSYHYVRDLPQQVGNPQQFPVNNANIV